MKMTLWIVLSLLACSSLTQRDTLLDTNLESSFQGRWNWVHNNEKRNFSVTIHYDKDTLNGTYCSIMQYGSRIDCGDDSVSFSMKLPKNDTVTTQFNSFYQYGSGLVELSLVHKDTLKWLIIERPSVPCFAPDSAMLFRDVQQ